MTFGSVVGGLEGVELVINRFRVQLPAVHCRVST